MKKLFPYILIVLIIVQLLAPFTVGIGVKNNLEVRSNKVEAGWDPAWDKLDLFKNAFKQGSVITVDGNFKSLGSNPNVDLTVKIDTGIAKGNPTKDISVWQRIEPLNYISLGGIASGQYRFVGENALIIVFQDNEFKYSIGYADLTTEFLNPYDGKRLDPTMPVSLEKSLTFGIQYLTPIGNNGIIAFSPGVTYTATLYYKAMEGDIIVMGRTTAYNQGSDILKNGDLSYFPIVSQTFTTATDDNPVIGNVGSGEAKIAPGAPEESNLACTFPVGFKIGACIAQGLYWLFFKTTSAIFGLAGKVLDFTLMYSIQDSSYRSAFVVEGWGLVRDFCNMFFIFVLLYIAFGTILKINGVNTKQMIINVVIIGLLINFSLFATQVIIDASNILTRVFYNQNTIVIGTPQKDAEGNIIKGTDGKPIVVNKLGDFNEIKLSEAIVSKVDPQDLIINSQKVNEIPVKEISGGDTSETAGGGMTVGSFILIIFLSTAVNVVGIIAFLSCAIIFISRVVGLWLAMILAPLAFFSYTIPALQDMKMIGWKRWWPETLKLAFLAPVFAFFMYLIVGFMDKGLGVFETSTKTGLSFVVAIVVPFVFIMILLMKAKDIAKDMSGEMGQSITSGITKAGGMALGVAGGAALGAGAGLLRGTVGRGGSWLANNETLKRAESRGVFGAKTLRNIGSTAGKGSFDARGVKIAGKGLSDTGLKGLGKAKEGGFEKSRADKVVARQKRAKELEVGEDSAETQAVRQAEHALHAIKTDRARQDALIGLNNGIAFDQRPAAIATATTNLGTATAARATLPPTATAEEIRLANNAITEATAALVSANVADQGLGGLERTIATAERAVVAAGIELKDAETTLLAATTPAQKRAAQAIVDTAKINRNTVVVTRDQAKNNLEARQATIRNQERPVHLAEDNLKRAENAKIEVNNQTRQEYATTIQGGWSQSVNFITSGLQHSFLGEREAANKILSGIQEEKKITEHH